MIRMALGVFLVLSSMASANSPDAISNAMGWRDPVTKYEYLYLPKKHSYSQAVNACEFGGMDLFNIHYLSAEERERFLKSPLFQALPIERRYVGDPREMSWVSFWISGKKRLYSGHDLIHAATIKTVRNKERVVEESHIDEDFQHLRRETLCMYRGDAWYSCEVAVNCRSYMSSGQPGRPSYRIPMNAVTYHYTEEGASHAEVWQRLYRRGYVRTTFEECELQRETFTCTNKRDQ